jgi:hypothetical protein
MASSVPAFKTALKSRLTATLKTAQVSYGAGNPDALGKQAIIVGPAKNRVLEHVCGMGISGAPINETYDVDVIVSVIGPEQETHEALSLIAYGLVDGIVSSVLSWNPLPSGVDIVVPVESEDGENSGEGWREAFVTQTLHVTARI